MALQVDYLKGVHDKERFYNRDLIEQLDLLMNESAFSGRLIVYPDAHFEGWGIPTGLLFVLSKQTPLLLPTFLRDPGCGFLIFQIAFFGTPPSNWQMDVGDYLDSLIRKGEDGLPPCHPTVQSIRNCPPIDLKLFSPESVASPTAFHSALREQGLADIAEHESHKVWRSLGAVTNGIELRSCKPCGTTIIPSFSDYDRMIGFVHSGSTSFPKILENRFAFRCAEFALDQRLFSYCAVEKGVFGVSISSQIGEEYAHWLRIAANVASLNRMLVFQAIKQRLEHMLPCRVSKLSNVPHCGITIGVNGDLLLYRGVQPMTGSERNQRRGWPLTFVAGHRETDAALVLPGTNSVLLHDMISHGTSWIAQNGDTSVGNKWSPHLDVSRRHAASAYYNTRPNHDNFIPYTLNLYDELSLFEYLDIAQTIALCNPLINIQGEDVIVV